MGSVTQGYRSIAQLVISSEQGQIISLHILKAVCTMLQVDAATKSLNASTHTHDCVNSNIRHIDALEECCAAYMACQRKGTRLRE